MTWWKEKPTDPDRRRGEAPRSQASLRQFWFEFIIMASAWGLFGLLVWAIKG